MPAAPREADIAPDVSILIVAYNSRDFIGKCIETVIAHTREVRYEILLVDNGTDGTADLVAQRFAEVRIVPGMGNIGFGRGNNLLADYARGQYLLLLNPDTWLVDPAIDRLLAFARSHPGAAWGGIATTPDGALQPGSFQSLPTVWSAFWEAAGRSAPAENLARFRKDPVARRVEVLSGGFMLITRAAWEKVGGFDPSFLLYAEEVDLFARLKGVGGEVWLVPDSRIIHDVGSGSFYSPVRMNLAQTGRMHYARRHWRAPAAQIAGFAYWLVALRRWLVSALMSPVSATHRARRRAFAPLVLRPGGWWNGYAGRNSLD
ncbi:glycosyltransferase family 2 protein [Erythrobacter sp. WG]|uniref:glycosyltransferase family 2 protein n=1 Tax=Erythrobacter sp. WG TaxID=2985510 RepID=UPI00226DBDF3|nr:glycosyltransferase family 2 protein [Erythrobacter sp. WG]MCX9147033.1 glycosyltransferase family 2 protein [Erythrobacter sp. WG]